MGSSATAGRAAAVRAARQNRLPDSRTATRCPRLRLPFCRGSEWPVLRRRAGARKLLAKSVTQGKPCSIKRRASRRIEKFGKEH
jgi:hypothetical protein